MNSEGNLYVSRQRAAGLSDEQISATLLSNGWQIADVQAALQQAPPAKPVRTLKVSARGAVAAAACLVLACGAGAWWYLRRHPRGNLHHSVTTGSLPYSFTYPAAWKLTSSSSAVTLKSSNASITLATVPEATTYSQRILPLLQNQKSGHVNDTSTLVERTLNGQVAEQLSTTYNAGTDQASKVVILESLQHGSRFELSMEVPAPVVSKPSELAAANSSYEQLVNSLTFP